MIISLILSLFGQLWEVAFSVLPTGSLPAAVGTSLKTVVGWLYVADPVIPIDTLLSLLTTFFVIEASIQAVQFFFWLYSKIPLIGK